ncbi:MAG: 2-haloacrylate reductase [Phycisphaerae bacterium]|nr:2-haloacrylate reductase [Phycisphaerae bacterium]
MKAMIFDQPGDPDVLHAADLPTPEPGPGQIRVRVDAVALNRLDLWIRAGQMGRRPIPMPHILGSDVCGQVDALGHGVRGPTVGTHVIVAPGFGCGHCPHCAAGRDSMCPQYQLLGFQVQGGYAQFVVADARNVIPISDNLTPTQWAAVPLDFLTAWHMIVTRAALQPGEDVLVQAAGSGVGSAAIQIARFAGAGRVITTASTAGKLGRGRQLGADVTVNYAEHPDFAKQVLDATGGKGVEVIVDHVGAGTWEQCLACLATGGRLVTCGATGGGDVSFNIQKLYFRQHQIIGSMMGTRSELDRVLDLLAAGRLTPVVDRTFPLEQAPAAHRHMLSRAQFGKIVLKVS